MNTVHNLVTEYFFKGKQQKNEINQKKVLPIY